VRDPGTDKVSFAKRYEGADVNAHAAMVLADLRELQGT
jgi:hypothetical protein